MNFLSYREFFEMLKEIETRCETEEENDKILVLPNMNWPVEKERFLKLVFEPIWRKCDPTENMYSWIAKKRLGVGIFWSDDQIWEWLRKERSDYISENDATILFKNARNFLNQKKLVA